MASGMPTKSEEKINRLMAFIRKYTSHLQSCQRLRDDIAGKRQLSGCNCGFDEAFKKLLTDCGMIGRG